MNSKQIEILLIEDNPGDVRLIREMMSEVPDVIHKIERTERLDEGLERLTEEDFDLLLLDLRLPDSQGLDTFVKAHTQATEVPIVVLTGLEDEELGLNVVRRGAQDYLVKQKVNGSQLVRAIRYAIERKRTEETIMEMAYQDPLTGLPNRRGFSVLAQLQLKIANRKKRNLLLLFADLDDLKSINDKLGHHEGDRALIEIADLLRETFRSSDIIARVGGDEFVVLAIESSKKCSEVLTDHLQKKTDTYNMKNNRPYRLSISIGMVQYNPEYPCSIDDLINKADKLMYKQKHGNRKF